MKKLLLIGFILLTFYAKSQTWVYHKFPDANAIWNFEMAWPCPPIVTLYEDFSITITGDTLINGKTYHKLFTPHIVQSYGGTWCGSEGTGYKGAIRQDTINKKVFKVTWDTTEYLLYDFNMQVGDTVKGIIESTSVIKDTVQSIDSVLVGGSYRKRWVITNGIYIVEGIGSTFGFIENSYNGVIGTFPYCSLLCFSQNGIPLYPNTSTNCELITSVNSSDKTQNKIKVFPNPSEGSFTIDFDKADIKEIILTDLLGNIILRKQTDKQTNINIDNLNSGIYFYKIFVNERLVKSDKIIINK